MVTINKKLLPAAVLVRKERDILNGQAKPKPNIINASKILIFSPPAVGGRLLLLGEPCRLYYILPF